MRREPDFHPPQNTRPRPPDKVLLFAADAHHHRRIQLARQNRRNNHDHGAGHFAAKPTARVFAHQHHLLRIQIHPARDRRSRLEGALRARVQIEFSVLPISHRGARLQALMAHVGRHKRFIQHQCGIAESRIEIAVRRLAR
jgi:hypothetical protein